MLSREFCLLYFPPGLYVYLSIENMYLQSLELVGFKSFAQKTLLEFHRGVTAIVGPNGCGKSNVLDAIRWVLGEQSAKALRGGEMADVIFGGTESRQALGMAEVSMTFTECEKDLDVEWNEVCVTRRIFRDGRSEYFLNKTPCRLKDIHQLFMDTGIGRSAYSIMEQGKLDQILSSRPEDRRVIFEEAAGITKYKAQKKEALRKLEYTESNLLRATDIIKEVKRQIGSLQRQAAKARRFQLLLNDLRLFDTHLNHRNHQVLQVEWKEIQTSLEKCEDSRRIYENGIEGQETELARLRIRQEEIDLQISTQRDQLQILKNQIFASEQRIETHGQRKAEFAELVIRNQAEIQAATSKLQAQESQIAETDRLIQELLVELNNRQQELDNKEAVFRNMRDARITTEQTLHSIYSEARRLEEVISSLRGEISAAEGKQNAIEARNQMLASEANTLRKRLGEAQERLKTLEASVTSTTLALEQAKGQAQDVNLQVQETLRKKQQIEGRLGDKNKTLAEQESRLKVLSELEASGEGLDKGTQAVLQGLNHPDFFKPAILGTLASLIEVVPDHIQAVETVLGSSLQTILVKDSSLAESILETLSSKELGRASVSPRNWIFPFAFEKPPLPKGALSWLLDSVHCSEDLYPLVLHLLSNVLLVSQLEVAFQLKEQHPKYGFVTLEGEFLSSNGIATGGLTRKTPSSTLFRRAQLVELEKLLRLTCSELEVISTDYKHAVHSWEADQTSLKECHEHIQKIQWEHSTLRSQLAVEERESHNCANKLASVSAEIQQLAIRVQQVEEQQTTVESRLQETLARLKALRESENTLRTRLQEDQQRESHAFEDLQDFRLRIATGRQRQEALVTQRQPMAMRLDELTEVLKKRGEDIHNYENRICSLEKETIELRQEIIHWQEEIRTVEAQLTEFGARRHEIHESVEALEATLRTVRKQLTDLQDQQGQIEVRFSQLKMRLEHLCEHVQQRYQVTLSEFQPDSYALICALKERSEKKEEGTSTSADQQEIPWAQVKTLVAELTERVDSMGPVNLEAIQEYDELEQRHIFLEQQYNDLINSKTELLEVISKINQTTKELFADTFEKIRINFQEMFTELFGGGKANLLLVDESDPLESGVEIIAKPPGKQLQSISLLSGGERTMTAVSLLFAIYMVKPSPFCVLDEMDAPLDESNINRFIKILDRFVEQSQFLVITHNKRTISRANTLYGVTMEEHGVSKLVSVKFCPKDEASTPLSNIAETLDKHGNLQSEQEELVASIPKPLL